jgi:hypothetical protein
MSKEIFGNGSNWESNMLEDAFLDLFPLSETSNGAELADDFSLLDPALWLDQFISQEELIDRPENFDVQLSTFETNMGEAYEKLLGRPLDPPRHPDCIMIQEKQGLDIHPQPQCDRVQLEEIMSRPKIFNDFLFEFQGGPNIGAPAKKKRKYSPTRLSEVRQMRKIGACVQCKLAKSSVSL